MIKGGCIQFILVIHSSLETVLPGQDHNGSEPIPGTLGTRHHSHTYTYIMYSFTPRGNLA